MAVRSAAARLISSWSLYASNTRRWWAGSVVLNGSGDVSRALGPGFLFCFSASIVNQGRGLAPLVSLGNAFLSAEGVFPPCDFLSVFRVD
jgi:hypothetical protein